MKISTWIKLLLYGIPSLFFGVITIIGYVADFLGVAEGVEEHKELFQIIISYLASWWGLALVITALFAVASILIRRAYKKHNDYKDTMDSSWFDPHKRITIFSGGEEHLLKLRHYLKQRGTGLSWWAITGVAGIGKTRLVIEALESIEFDFTNVHWIKSYQDYTENRIKEKINDILKSLNPNSIIIAEDAQIYMENIGKLIDYFESINANKKRNHNIKLLLLIRMGEDEDLSVRYKQLESKVSKLILERTCFNYQNKELRIEKYEEADIADLVESYLVKTSKKRHKKVLTNEEMINIQKNTILTLRSKKIDPVHLRPLFAMFIADALLEGKEAAAWDRRDVLEYAVIEREDEFLKLEMNNIHPNNNHFIIDKIRGIICLSIIRNGIPFAELDGIRDELEQELGVKGIYLKDLLKDMQMMGKDGIIRLHMPDILSEYYVLRNVVIKPDDSIVEWIIGSLCDSLKGVKVQRQKIRQDFKYLYSEIEDELEIFYIAFFENYGSEKTFDIIVELLSELDLCDSNAILLHDAVGNQIDHKANIEELSRLLCNILISNNKKTITDKYNIEDKRICLWELDRLQEKFNKNTEVAINYARGLYAMMYYTTDDEESRKCLEILNDLLCKDNENADIENIYCKGLNVHIKHCLNMEEKTECLSKIYEISHRHEICEPLDLSYSFGLFNMIIATDEIKKKEEYLLELKKLSDKNVGNEDIACNYCRGLLCICSLIKETESIEEYVRMIGELSTRFNKNEIIAELYSGSLYHVIYHTQDVKVRQKYMTMLEDLATRGEGNETILLTYYECIFDLYRNDMTLKNKHEFLSKLRTLYERNRSHILFSLIYGNVLITMMEEDETNKNKYIIEIGRIISNNPLMKAVEQHDYKSINWEAFSGAGIVAFQAEEPMNIG